MIYDRDFFKELGRQRAEKTLHDCGGIVGIVDRDIDELLMRGTVDTCARLTGLNSRTKKFREYVERGHIVASIEYRQRLLELGVGA